jgi:hypothetical protein
MGAIMDGFTRVCIHTDSICPAYRNTLDGAALRSYVATGFAFEISVLFEEKTKKSWDVLQTLAISRVCIIIILYFG